ncbi:MAG: hypothetical protein OEV21_03925, partial [Thermoplasmata archaeon]|nr:hypothetical protein [Thermoplasmata archaeon]
MSLPQDVLRARLRNEIDVCQRQMRHHLVVSDTYLKSFPVTIDVSLLRVPGPTWEDSRVVTRHIH